MIYNETYVALATTVNQLIHILSTEVPRDATVDVAAYDHKADVEIWYDKDTNTVILK